MHHAFQGLHVAMKRVAKARLSKTSGKRLLQQEIDILQVLSHPNVVKLYDVIDDAEYTNLAMEVWYDMVWYAIPLSRIIFLTNIEFH